MYPLSRGSLLGALTTALLLVACDAGNPVAPAAPVVETPTTVFTITLAADPPKLTAGAATGSTISVTVVRNDTGQPPSDGTQVVVNTGLGNFGVDAAGTPVQLVTLSLRGGKAQTTLLASAEDVGTASLLAQASDSSAQLTVQISEPGDPPEADFAFEVDGFNVTFADGSTGNPTSWSWSFGDGNTSLHQNPAHQYTTAGTFAVRLTVTNGGGSSTKNQLVTVPSGEPPSTDFSFQANGLTVNFLDASSGNPTSWTWDFGDGSPTNNEQNPVHTYTAAGTFTVSLTTVNEVGSNTANKLVTVSLGEPPTVDFDFQVDGFDVTFLDTSSGGPTTWDWDFGDGNSSSLQNPTHTYAAAGTFAVRLTATNAAGSNNVSKLVTISLGDPPTADYSFQIDAFSVNFLDASSGSPTAWAWDFGDGNTSTLQNPAHTYDAAGTFTVSLTATNAAGSDTIGKLITVPSGGSPAAEFSFEINRRSVIFTDLSSGEPNDWSWAFGDGATSTDQNPVHCYDADGTYAVSLTVSNDIGSSSTSKFVTVSDADNTACP